MINGGEKGSPLAEIQKIPPEALDGLKRTDVFLDSATGDLYSYSKDIEQWNPIGNTGLHNARTADTYGTVSDYIKKIRTYKPKAELSDSAAYVLNEKRVTLTKQVILWFFVTT